eukprot:scaffold119710_cov23-Tisochrysis_lutea.AAC.1
MGTLAFLVVSVRALLLGLASRDYFSPVLVFAKRLASSSSNGIQLVLFRLIVEHLHHTHTHTPATHIHTLSHIHTYTYTHSLAVRGLPHSQQ